MEQDKLKEYWQGFPEAPYSDTFKWIDAEGYEHMMTVRGWEGGAMLGAVAKAKEFIAGMGGKSPSQYQASLHSSDTVPNMEPVRQPIDDNGNDLPEVKHARAGRLSVEMKDGKYFYRVMDATFAAGEKGTKYGINVYPEVLAAANLDVTPGQPVPNISGWLVDYILNDKGYPWKVTRLLPPR